MNCHQAQELFSARADDRLTPEERLALDRHLHDCPDCPDEWEQFRQTVALLRSVEEARAPAGFAGRVLEAARREEDSRLRRLLRGLFVPLHVKLPLEAAAVLAVSTLVMLLYRQTPDLERASEIVQRPSVVAPAPAPAPKPAEPRQTQAPTGAPSPEVALPRPAPPAARPEPGAIAGLESSREGDRPEKQEKKEEAERPTRELGKGRADAFRQALKAAPAPPLESRARGPFHLVGMLRPKDVTAIEAQLNDLARLVGGTLSRDPNPIAAGSIIEVVVSREEYSRFEAGLRQLGDFTVETQAQSLPEQVRIAIRID
ncbi:MAG: zf-HC2 domain-containing protein [Candidatus Rokubacteria bacterium]|nr:zf-HC2 domain-containing protein [Candidatus Rokubacteria bacterium]